MVTAVEQRAFAEGLLPAAEQQLREQGVSEAEIAVRIAELREAEPGFRDVESERRRF